MSLEGISSAVGVAPEKLRKILKLILDKNVFSKTEEGIIYSRRMVRDIEYRRKQAKLGRQGQKVKRAKETDPQGNLPLSAKSDAPAAKAKAQPASGPRDKISYAGHQWYPSDLLKYLKQAREQIRRHLLALEEITQPDHRAEIRASLKKMRDLEQGLLDAIRTHPWDPQAKTKIEYDGLMYYPGELLKHLESLESDLKAKKKALASGRAGLDTHNVCDELIQKIADLRGMLKLLPVPQPVLPPTLRSPRRQPAPELAVPPEKSRDPKVISAAVEEARQTIDYYVNDRDNEFTYTRGGKLTKWARDRISFQERRIQTLQAKLEKLNPIPA